MKKNLLLFVLLGCVLLLCSCCVRDLFRQKQSWEADTIASIEIVRFDNSEGTGVAFEPELTVLAEVSDKSGFLQSLNAVKQTFNYGEPHVLRYGDVVIRVEYKNGDYDLLGEATQLQYRSENEIPVNYGRVIFEHEPFEELLRTK